MAARPPGKAGKRSPPKPKDGQPPREPLDPRPVGLGRVPVPAHTLQDAVGTRLQRRVQMRRQVARRFDEEPGERVVDLGSFHAAKPEADIGDGSYERFEELPECPHPLTPSPPCGEGGRTV